MNLTDRLRNAQVSTRAAVISIGLLLVLLVAVVLLVKNLAGGSPARATAAKPGPKDERAVVRISEDKTSAAKSKPANAKGKKAKQAKASSAAEPAQAPKQESKSPYAVIAERNLFRSALGGSTPTPPPGPAGGKAGNLPPLPGPSGGPKPPPSGGGSDEFKKTIAFTGIVETPSGLQALVENLPTKETRFVAKGDSAFGCKVVGITEQTLSLDKDGSNFTLSIGENKPDTEAGGKPGEPAKPNKPGEPPPPGH